MKIVLVEDNPDICNEVITFINRYLEYEFLKICYRNSDAVDTVSRFNPDIVLTSENNNIDHNIEDSVLCLKYRRNEIVQSLKSGFERRFD